MLGGRSFINDLMTTAKKILGNTLVQIMGKAVVTVVALFFITRPLTQLGDKFYGEYAFVYRFLGFFAIFADFGLFTIAVREMSANKERSREIFGNIFGLRILLVVLVMSLAGGSSLVLGLFYPDKFTAPVQIGMWLAGLSVVFTMMATTIASVFQVNYRMSWSAFAEVANKIVMAFVITLVFMRMGGYGSTEDFWFNNFHWFFVAGVLGNFTMLVIRWWKAGEFMRTKPRFDFKFWGRAVKESLPYGLALIVNAFHFQVDSLMIFLMRPEGAKEVGAYDVAFKVLEILNIIPVYFLNAVLPVLVLALNKVERARKVIDYGWRFLLAVAVPIFFGGWVVAPQIIRVIVKNPGEGFFVYSPEVLVVLLGSLVFIFLNSLFGFTLVAQKRQGELLKINLVCLLFNVGLNLLVIPRWGFRGAAVTTVASEALVLVLAGWAVNKKLRLKMPAWPTIKILLSGGGMFLILWGIREASLLILLPVGVVVYLFFMIMLRGVPLEAWVMLKPRKSKTPPPGDEPEIIDITPGD